ncbi:MAG: hypothetical protein HYX27_04010 [Acidobacteria bacterium]|nr:hypothetical protein [Acidobacteriota bacterium]
MPLLLAATVAALSAWVPMRWPASDPATLKLLEGTPINCLLLEPGNWSPAFTEAAHKQGITVAGIVSKPWDAGDAKAAKLDAIFSEGPQQESAIPILPRSAMQFEGVPITATNQGVWPGVNPVDADHAKAAPSGGPWIDTNAGFLRFARALTSNPVWIANTPPTGKAYPISRYLQVAAEAAMCGARWVIALDKDFEKRLLSNDANAVRDWRKLASLLAFIESQKEKLQWPAAGQLTLIQDAASGSMLSGGILDMIAVKHTPVRPIPASKMKLKEMRGAVMAVNVSPSTMTSAEREVLAQFTRSGGTVLTGPKNWQFPTPREGQVVLDERELTKLDAIWKEVNTLTGRRNLGARLFNAGTMLSNLTESPDHGKQLLHLVNYTDFPVESITVHMLGNWKKATLLQPGVPPKILETYPTEEGTGIDIPEMSWYAILELE